MKTTVMSIFLLMLVLRTAHSARILGIIPTPSISHQLPFRVIALELVKRGHQVTFVTTNPIKKNITNYTEIDISYIYDFWRATYDFTAMSNASALDMFKIMYTGAEKMCNIHLSSSQVQDLLKSQQTFDMIIAERMGAQCMYGLFHKLGSPPLVGFTSFGAVSPVYTASGNIVNTAYIPELMLGYSDHMTFWQRLHNTCVMLGFSLVWFYVLGPQQEGITRKYFGPNVPPVYETEKNFSLILINNHFSMNYPRPMLPNMVELTGLHLEKQRRPLPKDLKNFLDGAENGVIYFSLGTNVKSSTMTEEKRRAFVEAFAQLPQRVLWKWEEDNLPSRPDNVKIAKWLPQQDVLAHPNIRLFITQGGMQSMNEAGYFAIPMVVIPFMPDQHHNSAKIVQAGIGYRLYYEDVTRDSVLEAIRTVLGNQSYKENMKRFSVVFREHQETSLERAVWWIEYVLRHNGAPHLRNAAVDMPWWQLLLLDVIAFLVITTAIVLYALYRLARCIARSVRRAPKLKSQ